MTTERTDLVNAVLASRDETDPNLETELLEAIVDAEVRLPGDSEGAMRAIDAAVTAAIERGVGNVQEPASGADEAADSAGEEGGA